MTFEENFSTQKGIQKAMLSNDADTNRIIGNVALVMWNAAIEECAKIAEKKKCGLGHGDHMDQQEMTACLIAREIRSRVA